MKKETWKQLQELFNPLILYHILLIFRPVVHEHGDGM